MCLSSLGPVSCVFTSWVSSGLTTQGSGYSLMAARWQVLFPEFPQCSLAHLQWWNRWWLGHPLFTDVAGNIPLIRSLASPNPDHDSSRSLYPSNVFKASRVFSLLATLTISVLSFLPRQNAPSCSLHLDSFPALPLGSNPSICPEIFIDKRQPRRWGGFHWQGGSVLSP